MQKENNAKLSLLLSAPFALSWFVPPDSALQPSTPVKTPELKSQLGRAGQEQNKGKERKECR